MRDGWIDKSISIPYALSRLLALHFPLNLHLARDETGLLIVTGRCQQFEVVITVGT